MRVFRGWMAALMLGTFGMISPPAVLAAPFDECLNSGDAGDGIEACRESLAQSGLSAIERASVFAMLGYHQRRDGALDDARGSLEQSLALTPADPRVLAELALVQHLVGDHEQSVETYGRALALAPGDARTHNNRAVVLLALDRVADAVRDLDFALSLDPGNGVAWNNRANAHCTAGNWDASYADRIQALYKGRFTAGAAQSGMRKTGFYDGPSDGIWGYQSETALRAWTRGGCPDAPKTRLD